MTPERFKQIVDARLAHCREVLTAKGEEYSRDGDRLHNFKSAGRKRGCTPEKSLLGMDDKHTVSIDDIVEDLEMGKLPTVSTLNEKISDAINYLLLLEGLIVERMDTASLPCPVAPPIPRRPASTRHFGMDDE